METSHIHVTLMMVGVVLASCHVMMAFLHVSEPHLEMTCLRLYELRTAFSVGVWSLFLSCNTFHPTAQDLNADVLSELGTRTNLVGAVLCKL